MDYTTQERVNNHNYKRNYSLYLALGETVCLLVGGDWNVWDVFLSLILTHRRTKYYFYFSHVLCLNNIASLKDRSY